MKKLCTALVLLPVVAFAAGLIDRNDQTMNGAWTFNKAVTIEGTTTLNGAVTVAGAMTYTGAPVFAANVEIDDGVTDSPTLKFIDADNKYLVVQKLDAGGANLTNNEGAINLLPSNDADDYIAISTANNIPSIATVGSCDLDLAPGTALNLKVSGDTDDYISITTTTDVPAISTVGACALDLAPQGALNIKASGDADDYVTVSVVSNVPSIGTAGACNLDITPAASLNIITSGDTDDYITISTATDIPSIATTGACDLDLAPAVALNIKASGDVDDYISITTSGNVPSIGTTGSCNLTIAPDGGTTSVTGALAATGAVTGNGGLGLAVISQAVAFGDFTDNEDATAYIDLTTKLPAGAIVLGWECVVATGFTGSATCTVQVGVAGALDKFSVVTDLSIFAAGTVGATVKAGNVYCAAETTVRVTATEDSDWGDITAGAMTVNVWYIATP